MNPSLPKHEDFTIVDSGTINGINWWVARIERSTTCEEHHHYTGYAEIPLEHPLRQLAVEETSYETYSRFLTVHGGITYINDRVIGFDTNHFGDTPESWTVDATRGETINLADQLAKIDNATFREKVNKARTYQTQLDALIAKAQDDGMDIDYNYETLTILPPNK